MHRWQQQRNTIYILSNKSIRNIYIYTYFVWPREGWQLTRNKTKAITQCWQPIVQLQAKDWRYSNKLAEIQLIWNQSSHANTPIGPQRRPFRIGPTVAHWMIVAGVSVVAMNCRDISGYTLARSHLFARYVINKAVEAWIHSFKKSSL